MHHVEGGGEGLSKAGADQAGTSRPHIKNLHFPQAIYFVANEVYPQ